MKLEPDVARLERRSATWRDPRLRLRPPPPLIAVALLLGCVFLLRLPAALIPHELNVDESQAISEGMKLLIDPRPWIAVDGQSCGPLHSYLITVLLLLGFKPGFVLAHMLASVLVCLQVLLAYLTLRRMGSERAAFLGGFLMVFAYGFTNRRDYLHYAGELLPSLFLATGFYLFILWLYTSTERQSSRSTPLAFLGGLALGTAPWCKLQAAPISAAMAVVFLLAILRSRSSSQTVSRCLLEAGALVGGAGLTTCVVLAALVHWGALKDFRYSYILANLQYAAGIGLVGGIERVGQIFRISPVNQLLMATACVFVYMALVGGPQPLSDQQRWAWGALLAYMGSAVFVVCRVHYSFPHHTIFLIAPMTYVVVMGAGACDVPRGAQGRHKAPRWLAAVLVFLGAITIALYATYALGYLRMIATLRRPAYGQVVLPVRVPKPAFDPSEPDGSYEIFTRARITAALIGPIRWTLSDSNERIFAVLRGMHAPRPVRSLAVWGWAPGVYVLSAIPPVTRDSNAYFVLQKGPLQQYFRSRYVADLRANPPDVFVDALTPDAYTWRGWTKDESYKSVPELRSFVEQNYTLEDELTLQEGAGPVRFFVRRVTR
jgi:hypothetical protein